MKTLQQIQDPNYESLDEGSLRTVSGVVIVGKIRTIEKQIKSTKIVDEKGNLLPQQLDKKIDLLSSLGLFQSILTGSLQLLSKGRGRR
tara:strand:+ start:384 stop:647 length:264 start_codon:yes stop_codon:yes gene_type:complete